MRFHRLTQYLLGHRWQALLLTFLMTYIPLLGMASIIIAGLFTLTVGVFEGALFTIAASLPYVLAIFSVPPEAMTPILWMTVILTVSGNVLTFAFAVMLRRGCNWSQVIQLAALFGIFVICVIHYFYPGIADWWSTQLKAFLSTGLVAQKPDVSKVLLESEKSNINLIKYHLTGMVTAFVLLTAVIQTVAARWWQMAVVNHASISPELQSIRLSRLAGFLFILAIVLYYLENRIILDILPVLCLLFAAAGLSLVHNLCTTWSATQGRQWLYVALTASLVMLALMPLFSYLGTILPVVLAVLLLLICIFVFMILSLLDVWLDLRKRARKT